MYLITFKRVLCEGVSIILHTLVYVLYICELKCQITYNTHTHTHTHTRVVFALAANWQQRNFASRPQRQRQQQQQQQHLTHQCDNVLKCALTSQSIALAIL